MYATPVASPSPAQRALAAKAQQYASAPRQGTSSSLSSSSSSSASPSQRPKIVSISAQYPLRLLLAEDNLINQKMMVMTLRRLGYEISVASNGREALSLLELAVAKGKQFEFECILMDVSMDGMDGLECTRVIREQQLPHRTVPFIIAQTGTIRSAHTHT